jgi:hypothetical protein
LLGTAHPWGFQPNELLSGKSGFELIQVDQGIEIVAAEDDAFWLQPQIQWL